MKQLMFLPAVLFVVLAHAQNVGVGTTLPAGKVQINHRSTSMPGLLLVDSFSNSAGRLRFQSLSHGNGITMSVFSANSFSANQYLDVGSDSIKGLTVKGDGRVGVNNLSPAYQLDVNGDVNARALIRLSGDAGLPGEVLTSNGPSADPQWKPASFSNTVRFSFNLSHSGIEYTDSLVFNGSPANYNLSPSLVFVSPTNSYRLVINKTGLYHFNGAISMTVLNTTNSSWQPRAVLYYSINNKTFPIGSGASHSLAAIPDDDWEKTFDFSFDVYLTAGQTLKFTRMLFGLPSNNHQSTGYLNGYLISE